MSLFSKTLVVLLLAVVVYSIWPRYPSLSKFDPVSVADRELTAWAAIRKGNGIKAWGNYFWIYDREFQISPIRALTMSREYTSAVGGILRAADDLDKESYVPRLVEVYVALQRETGMDIDGPGVGRAAFLVWLATSQHADAETIENAVSQYLTALFRVSAATVKPAAALRANALRAAFPAGDAPLEDARVRAMLQEYWKEILRIAPKDAPAAE